MIFGVNANAGNLEIGLKADNDGIKEFYLAIGDYYKSPEKEITVIRSSGIPDDDLPVVFFLARHAGVEPGVIMKLRLGGKTWMDITLHYGLSPEIYYIELRNDPGPPYGKAYGHFKKRPRKEWGAIRFADSDIVNFVNLKFISEHYHYSPDDVIKMRSGGESFVKINGKVKQSGKNQGKADGKVQKKNKVKGKKK